MLTRLVLSAAATAAFSIDVETRRSTLSAWGSGTELGWAVERRTGGAIEVSVGWRAADGEDGGSLDSDVTVVTLPDYLADTGGISAYLWPSALAGSILLRSPTFRSALAGKDVLELGSGLGLAGLVAATAGASRCVLTDKSKDAAVTSLKDTIVRNSIHGCELEARELDWKDEHTNEAKADVVIGTDLAYYYHLLRPLMDTSRACLRPDSGLLFIVGQANRESHWDLYHNIIDGCYNQLTDKHEPPWPGQARMLLYDLFVGPWNGSNSDEADLFAEEIPIAALLHTTRPDRLASLLTLHDHVATKADEESQMMSF